MIIAYLRTLSSAGSREPERGNAQNGETLFWGRAGCGGCHMVGGRGGRLGPDLSRIGAARSSAALTSEIRTPSEYVTRGYEAVTVVTQDGRRIRGATKNEDPFSIQIMSTDEQILLFDKKDLREVTQEKRSLMPDYPRDRLSDAELDDVIRYLRTLRP
jgi:putative heme-binding domain-containing protein